MGKDLEDWQLPSLWAVRHRIIRGRRFQFYSKKDPIRHRPWAQAIVDDMHPSIVVKKARQMGVTELMLGIKAIHMATMVTSTSVYTMPINPKAEEIARERLTPLGNKSSPNRLSNAMISRISGWNMLMSKHFTPRWGGGRSTLLMTGSFNAGLGESTAADAVYLDELDRMSQSVVAAFVKSLSSSPFGFLRKFSTPTFPQHGIDGSYNQSDQKKWMWKCSRCGHWQPLTRANILQRGGQVSLVQRLEAHDKTAHVLDGMFEIGCTKCSRRINRHTAKAEWVAKHPEITEYSGYAMSQLDCCWISAVVLMRELRDMGPGLGPWMNYDLGEAYLGDSGSVVEGWIYTMVNPELPAVDRRDVFLAGEYPGFRTVAGIDWGKRSYCLILGICDLWQYPAILSLSHFDDTDHPEDSYKWALNEVAIWGCERTVADSGYGQDRNPYMYAELRTSFWACLYPNTRGSSRKPVTAEPSFGPMPPPISDPNPVVTVDRTSSLKMLIANLRARRYQVAPMAHPDLEELDRHCRNVVIVLQPPDENKRDGVVTEVAVTLGPDHFLHTLNYAMVAMNDMINRSVVLGDLDTYSNNVGSEEYSDVLSGLPTGDDIAWYNEYINDIPGGFDNL